MKHFLHIFNVQTKCKTSVRLENFQISTLKFFTQDRINLSPFTKDFRVWGTRDWERSIYFLAFQTKSFLLLHINLIWIFLPSQMEIYFFGCSNITMLNYNCWKHRCTRSIHTKDWWHIFRATIQFHIFSIHLGNLSALSHL